MNQALALAAAGLAWLLAALVAAGAVCTAAGVTPHPVLAAVQGAAPRLLPLGCLLGVLLLAFGIAGRETLRGILPGGLLLVAALAWTVELPPTAGVRGEAGSHGFRILSVNLLITNDDIEHIASDVEDVDPDILVTLEAEEHTRRALGERLASYRVASVGDGARGDWAAIWVHERALGNIAGERPLRAGDETLPGIGYRIDGDRRGTGATAVHVVGVHLHSPTDAGDADAWRRELRDLANHARTQGDTLVLAGDFNAGAAHPGFADILSHLRDAGRSYAGTGTPTWPVRGRGDGIYRFFPPMLDIDHILTGGALSSKGYRTVHVHGSDHLGVTADVLLRDGAADAPED